MKIPVQQLRGYVRTQGMRGLGAVDFAKKYKPTTQGVLFASADANPANSNSWSLPDIGVNLAGQASVGRITMNVGEGLQEYRVWFHSPSGKIVATNGMYTPDPQQAGSYIRKFYVLVEDLSGYNVTQDTAPMVAGSATPTAGSTYTFFTVSGGVPSIGIPPAGGGSTGGTGSGYSEASCSLTGILVNPTNNAALASAIYSSPTVGTFQGKPVYKYTAPDGTVKFYVQQVNLTQGANGSLWFEELDCCTPCPTNCREELIPEVRYLSKTRQSPDDKEVNVLVEKIICEPVDGDIVLECEDELNRLKQQYGVQGIRGIGMANNLSGCTFRTAPVAGLRGVRGLSEDTSGGGQTGGQTNYGTTDYPVEVVTSSPCEQGVNWLPWMIGGVIVGTFGTLLVARR